MWEVAAATANIAVPNGANTNLTLTGYAPSAGSCIIGTTKGIRFAGTQFTTQNASDGQTVYASFLLYQTAAYPATSPGLIAFLDANPILNSTSAPMPTNTGMALLIDGSGHIGINGGLALATGAQFETSATPLNTTNLLIVARYTFHTSPNKDVVDLWVNPASSSYGATAPAPDITVTSTTNLPGLAYFTFSYNGSDNNFKERWDEVRLATTWARKPCH